MPCSRDGQVVSTSSPPTQSQPSYSHVTQSLPSSIDKSSLSSGSSQRPHKHTSADPCGQSFVSPPMRARISKLSLRRQSTPEEVSHPKRSKGSAHKPSSSCYKIASINSRGLASSKIKVIFHLCKSYDVFLIKESLCNNPSFYQDLSRQWTGVFFTLLQSVGKEV